MQPHLVVSGSSVPELARRVAAELGAPFEQAEIARFPDGELYVRAPASVRDEHVVIVQSTCAPVEQHLLELCLLSDACRRSGAKQVNALIPYFGYARQDRRTHAGDAIALRVVTDLLATVEIARVIGVDVHCAAIEAISSLPFEHVTAVPLLIAALREHLTRDSVVVAPDLGAAKLAQRVAKALDLPAAFVHKHRLSGDQVEALGLTGQVRGQVPVIVDDMISTGATIEAAAQLLLLTGCIPSITIAASHGLFVGPAVERLARLPLDRIIVTDSVPQATSALPIERTTLASALADAVRSLR
jgi:ribose-phosphate pyrophosphokinase